MSRLLTFVRVDGHLLRVSIRGEGRPLLLVMGLGGNIEMWNPLEQALAARGGIQTIAYDASGTGDSPARLVPLRVPGLARQAARLLAALGYPAADVLGVSFGGAVAQELAHTNPECVRRLVLASTTCGVGVPGHPVALALLATPLRYYSPAFFRLTATMLYGPTTNGDGARLRQQMHARRARPPTLWGYASQLAAGVGWTSLPWLHRLHVPTLVLTGDADRIVPAVNGRVLAARIPGARLEVVRGAGHLLLMDHAEHCAQSIGDFLDG
ncbi:MAG TPA: alpha/beta fold hydrolase [Acidimicrobiales bacterium]